MILKILILEDLQDDVDLIQRELKKSGLAYTAEIVQTRQAYENTLEEFRPDLILSDYSLPGFNGVMAFQIKQKKFPHIPFIIVSGVIGEEKAVELIKDGVTDYVLKDKLFTLSSKIARALKDDAETKEKKRIDLKLKAQYENLLEIALMQSHQVRGPITRIIGLSRLFKFDEPAHPLNGEIVSRMKAVAVSLDKLIHKIVQKTSEIKEGR